MKAKKQKKVWVKEVTGRSFSGQEIRQLNQDRNDDIRKSFWSLDPLPSAKTENGRAKIMKEMEVLFEKGGIQLRSLTKDELRQYIALCHLILLDVYPEFRKMNDARQKGAIKTKENANMKIKHIENVIQKNNIDITTLKKDAAQITFKKYGVDIPTSTLWRILHKIKKA